MAQLPLWASIILSILIFLVAITVIVAVHEAGHLAAAKIFGVYCFDYSIGFGPKIFRKRRKGKETYFSLRSIPLGGYVSMYGEGDPSEEEKEVYIAPSRSLNGISHPKKFVVMGAGVFLNFILGFLILLFANSALPRTSAFSSLTFAMNNASEQEINEQARLENNFFQESGYLPLILKEKGINEYSEAILFKDYSIYDSSCLYPWIVNEDVEIKGKNYMLCQSNAAVSYQDDSLFFSNYSFFEKKEVSQEILNNVSKYKETEGKEGFPDLHLNFIPDFEKPYIPNEEISINVPYKTVKYNKENSKWDLISEYSTKNICISSRFVADDQQYEFECDSNLAIFLGKSWYGKQAPKMAWNQFSNGCSLIFQTLARFFTPETFNQIGGPVKIIQQTQNILTKFDVYTMFYFFGLISINLGIINLLPFPGLDGWHLFVCLFEGISKKNIPNKVKNIVSTIGLLLLFVLMGVILVKDIVGLF